MLYIDMGWGDRYLGRNQLQLDQTSSWMSGEDRAEGCFFSLVREGKAQPLIRTNQLSLKEETILDGN